MQNTRLTTRNIQLDTQLYDCKQELEYETSELSDLIEQRHQSYDELYYSNNDLSAQFNYECELRGQACIENESLTLEVDRLNNANVILSGQLESNELQLDDLSVDSICLPIATRVIQGAVFYTVETLYTEQLGVESICLPIAARVIQGAVFYTAEPMYPVQ